MNIFRWLSAACLSLSFFSCSPSPEKIKDFDGDVWKSDRQGCEAKRLSQIDNLIHQREKLLALDEMAIVNILGKPDEHEIYKRNQKFYYYYIEPGPECSSLAKDAGQRLVIRFNAVGLAKEIDLE